MAALLNAVLRASIGHFLVAVLRHPDDPRFAGKAIPLRNLVVVTGLSLLFPVAHVLGKGWRRYPFGYDDP
jgi:hypothetical protein